MHYKTQKCIYNFTIFLKLDKWGGIIYIKDKIVPNAQITKIQKASSLILQIYMKPSFPDILCKGLSCSLTHTSSTSLMSSKMQFRFVLKLDWIKSNHVYLCHFEILSENLTITIKCRRSGRMKTRSELS